MHIITDAMRKEMCKIINNSSMLLIAATKFFAGKYKKLNLELLLIDYYNSLMVKKNMHTLDNNDIRFLDLINNNKVDDLMFLTVNINFISEAFAAMVNFESLSTLDKHQIVRIADYEKEENDLTSRPLYKLNFIANGLSHNVEDLVKYYNEYIEINGNDLINHDGARDIILNWLKEIRECDFENYRKAMLNAIPVYYKWGKYIISKAKKDVDVISKIFVKRIEWLKFQELLELTKYDNEFLSDIITQYLYFETLPQDIVNNVEEYCDKKLTKRMKRKIENMK